MNNIKDKLLDIIKDAIEKSSKVYANKSVTYYDTDLKRGCEEIANSIIKNLPKILFKSEYVRIPAKIGETIYYTSGDEIKQLLIRNIRLNGLNYITYFGYDPNDKNRKEINAYECYRIENFKAEQRLKALERSL